MELNPLPYRWRSKTYTAIYGLIRAVSCAYKGAHVTFTDDELIVSWEGPRPPLHFRCERTHEATVIERYPLPAPVVVRRRA